MSEPVNTPTPTPTEPALEPNQGVDYGKLEEIVNKGVETKVSYILKSYAEQHSLNLEELKGEFKKIQDSKKLEDVKETDTYKELQNQYNQLKSTLKTNKINDEIKKVAIENGLTEEQLPYIQGLFKTEDIYNEQDETVNIEKITEEITGFVNAFKTTNKNLGYSGGNSQNQGDQKQIKTDSEKELDRIFGLI